MNNNKNNLVKQTNQKNIFLSYLNVEESNVSFNFWGLFLQITKIKLLLKGKKTKPQQTQHLFPYKKVWSYLIVFGF